MKLLDWGVARVEGEEDPFRGLIAGTLTYVAPEQIRGDVLSPAADVYSLAVLAYHLLCRRPPFQAANDLALIHMHLRAEPPKPSIAWPEIPNAIEALLLAMLAKTAEQRPSLATVETVLRDCTDEVDNPTMRFADGSLANIPLPALESPWTRWLMTKRTAPVIDELELGAANEAGRAVLPLVPPLRIRWMGLAVLVAAGTMLVSALNF